jgi:hypothetical protein
MLAAGGVALVWPTPGAPPMRLVTPATPVAEERIVSGPLLDRTAAWLTVGDAAARVRVRFARMPGLLYRVSTAADAGVAPVVSSRGGRVTVRLTRTGRDGLDEVRIVLNRQVRWDIRLPAGAGEQQLNLRDGRLQRVEVGSAGLAEVWLPEPEGTVPIVFTGGVGTAVVSVGSRTPVRVRLSEGAGSVDTPWTTNNGTAAGTVLLDPVFRRARDRYAIRAEGGLGALVVRQSMGDEPVVVAPGRSPWTAAPANPPRVRITPGVVPGRKPGTVPGRKPGAIARTATPTAVPGTAKPSAVRRSAKPSAAATPGKPVAPSSDPAAGPDESGATP